MTRYSRLTAWKVVDQLGWETTFDAEFVALTQLQADAFVTSDAAHGLNGARRHEMPRLGQRAGMSPDPSKSTLPPA